MSSAGETFAQQLLQWFRVHGRHTSALAGLILRPTECGVIS